jgi:Condensation domain
MANKLPLTFQQNWLWSLLQRHSDWRCVVVYAFSLRGTLDIPLLERCFAEVIRRHGSLRTRITTDGGDACQQIDESFPCGLTPVTICGASRTQIQANATAFVEEISDRKIDPALGPWLSVRLLQLAEHEHWLILGMHRLIADCSSIDLVARELWLLYSATVEGRPSPFPADPPQYGEYALWQQRMHDDWLRRHAGYWQRRLDGAGRIRWPIDHRPAATPHGVVGRMHRMFESNLSSDLREFARKARTLAANVMLAIYVAVLWRWCRQTDFIVPFKIAGRQSEHKTVVGYFTQILYLRMEVLGTETFSELLSRVGNEFFAALSHQDFGRIAAQKPELLAGTFFQWITWHPHQAPLAATPAAAGASELTLERVSFRDFGEGLNAVPPGMVAVEVTFFDTEQGIYASGAFRADLFAAGAMERFMEELQSAAEEFVRNPHARLAVMPAPD